ncbi:hypothetical protein Tco_0707933 [Tanacetum coccineum]
MFEEPLSTDPIWSALGQERIISWRYYDTCRVHCLNLESMDIYMLIERQYPLSAEVCKAMLDKKLQGGKPDENCYKMLKMMEKQAGAKGLTSPEQTATGKGISNPFMASTMDMHLSGGQRTDYSRRVDFRPLQTWISQGALAKEPHTSFDELMETSFDVSAFILNRLNIKDPTQEILVGLAFELLKGTCKSLTELEYHLEECSKATTERLDWHNPEAKLYPFDLSKPFSLIRDHRGRQVIPQDFFINNDLEYLKGGDLSRRYSTLVTETKAATYEIIWIEDLVRNFLESRKVIHDKTCLLVYLHTWGKRNIAVTRLSIMKKYDYGHLEETEVRLEDQNLYNFREGPKGVIYKDQMNRNRLMRADELHKFSDGTLDDVRSVLIDIAKGIRMEYLPKRKWSGLDK